MKKFIRYLAIALPIWTIAGIWGYSKSIEVSANKKAMEYYTIQSHLACHQLKNAGCEYTRGCK